MKWIGRSGQLPAAAGNGANVAIVKMKMSTREFIIRNNSFISGRHRLSYRSFPRAASSAAPDTADCHALFEVSSRAYGFYRAFAAGAVHCRFVYAAHAGLYGGHVRHRRYRHGESVVADHVRLQQAAVRRSE